MKLFITAVLVAATVLGSAHVAGAARKADPARTAIALASRAAGRPVTLQCETADALRARTQAYALAYVVLDGSSVLHLGPTVCGWLAYPKSDTYGQALLAVIHEAMHLKYNTTDEAATERRALDAFPALAKAFYPGLNQAVLNWGAHRLDGMLADGYH